MRLVGRRMITDVICVSRQQSRICIDDAGFPAERVHWVPNWVDARFFRPDAADPSDAQGAASGKPKRSTYAYACGSEGRDYETLNAAAKLTDCNFVVSVTGFNKAAAELWGDPLRCEAVGKANRRWIERNADVRAYARRVRDLLAYA